MPDSVDSLFDRLLASLLPPRCVLCGRPGHRPSHDLCAACESELPAPPDACLRCGAPPHIRDDRRAGCRVRCLPYDRAFALCVYAHPVDAMIQALKYGGQLAIGRVLGQLLAGGAAELGLQLDVDCLLPVPLHPRRYAERGFNQSAEIARFAGRVLALPVEPGLAIRQTDTQAQVGLPLADRQANIRDAFLATPGSVRGRRIVIVDDVITTGSTVAELARALRRAGAASIDVWCVARARLDSTVHLP